MSGAHYYTTIVKKPLFMGSDISPHPPHINYAGMITGLTVSSRVRITQ